MNKALTILVSTFALFSLIGCTNEQDTSSQEIRYKVTFLNDDDSFLYETSVAEGKRAYFSGRIPTKEEDDEFTYEFQGWDKEDELLAVSSDITTKAVYKATAKENWGPIIWF